jgi:CheY-like chemotaxis protein/anti-sigma regulatory factor (Ser/Thr protein kinase)
MSVSYIIALGFFGHNISRSFVESLGLRFENISLVQELSEKKEMAEQANIAKSKFLAAASHDLRQPLHALSLFTSVLDESIQYPKVRKVVEQINASVNALQGLFNALLDISRLEAGVMTVEKTNFRLQALFDKLGNDFKPQSEEKGLRLELSPCSYTVNSDPVLLEQVLRNYVSNAIRYTPGGEVVVSCEEKEGRVCISVSDTGVGIAEEHQREIFNEFHQLNNPERDRGKGLGLGLAIVERIAGLLEHPITVESEQGKGATFSILVDTGNAVVKQPSELPSEQESPNDLLHTTVVVIDDDVSVQEGTEALLVAWGYDAVVVSSVNDAVNILETRRITPHGIIADYRLHDGKTGIDAVQTLHDRFGTSIPALIVTGDIAAERLREVNDSGLQLLHKPVPSVKLRAFVRQVRLRQQQNLQSPES